MSRSTARKRDSATDFDLVPRDREIRLPWNETLR